MLHVGNLQETPTEATQPIGVSIPSISRKHQAPSDKSIHPHLQRKFENSETPIQGKRRPFPPCLSELPVVPDKAVAEVSKIGNL